MRPFQPTSTVAKTPSHRTTAFGLGVQVFSRHTAAGVPIQINVRCLEPIPICGSIGMGAYPPLLRSTGSSLETAVDPPGN